MINAKAIEQFLNRKLQSYDWLKREDRKSIDASLHELGSSINFSGLWLHQKVCLLLLESIQRFNLHLDMGGGKTATVLYLLRHLKASGQQPKAIIFVPYITAVETWVEESQKHAPDLKCVPLLGSTVDNLSLLTDAPSGDLYVICYQSAVAMLAEPIKGKRKSKKSWSIDPKTVRKVFKPFNVLVMDEVHKCKSVSSLTYRMCRAISAKTTYSIGLTGTPFGRDLLDLWPQFYLIDFGETLGDTLGFYREAFFSQKPNYWGGYEYTFKKKLMPVLKRMIKHSSIRYAIDELHDMPRLVPVQRHFDLPEAIKSYVEEAQQKLKEAILEKGSYRAAESEYLRLRQLSSGFMTFHGTEDKVQIKFDFNPKLDALQELIEGMPLDCKMVVFHHFVFTNELISARLKDMKIKHARIWGKQRDPIGELRKFKSDPECRVLVLNSKSGSSALNLQNANYIVFFEQPDSAIDRQQAERRVWRPGQEKRVLLYDFLMKKTADDKLHMANKHGRNLLRELLDHKESISL